MATNSTRQDQVDFSGLILGFSSAALYYMGEGTIEDKRAPQRNLPLAKQNIDIILLLEEKTRGNRSPDEDALIQQLTTDLRIKFIEASKSN